MAAAVAAEATTAVATAAAAAWILRAHRTAQGQHGSVEDEEVEVPEGDSYGQCWVCPLDTPKHRHGSTAATSKMEAERQRVGKQDAARAARAVTRVEVEGV